MCNLIVYTLHGCYPKNKGKKWKTRQGYQQSAEGARRALGGSGGMLPRKILKFRCKSVQSGAFLVTKLKKKQHICLDQL